MDAYFGVFKAGSWWVMENADGLRDSLYIEDFVEEVKGENEECYTTSSPERRMRLTSLSGNLHNTITYGTGYAFTFFGVEGGLAVHFTRNSGFDQSPLVEHLGAFSIQGSDYNEVLRCLTLEPTASLHEMLFARHVGPIRWVAEQDTFDLVGYHVQ